MTNLALMVCSRSSWSILRCPKMVSKYSQKSPKSWILDQKQWWYAAGAPGRYSVVRFRSCCLFSRQCRLPPNCLLLLRHKPFFRSYSGFFDDRALIFYECLPSWWWCKKRHRTLLTIYELASTTDSVWHQETCGPEAGSSDMVTLFERTHAHVHRQHMLSFKKLHWYFHVTTFILQDLRPRHWFFSRWVWSLSILNTLSPHSCFWDLNGATLADEHTNSILTWWRCGLWCWPVLMTWQMEAAFHFCKMQPPCWLRELVVRFPNWHVSGAGASGLGNLTRKLARKKLPFY